MYATPFIFVLGLVTGFVVSGLCRRGRGLESVNTSSAQNRLQQHRVNRPDVIAYRPSLRSVQQQVNHGRAWRGTSYYFRNEFLLVGLALAFVCFQPGSVHAQVNFNFETACTYDVYVNNFTWTVVQTRGTGAGSTIASGGPGNRICRANFGDGFAPWNTSDSNPNDTFTLYFSYDGGGGAVQANGGGGIATFICGCPGNAPGTFTQLTNGAVTGNNGFNGQPAQTNNISIHVVNNTGTGQWYQPENASTGQPLGNGFFLPPGGSADVPISWYGLPDNTIQVNGSPATVGLTDGNTNVLNGVNPVYQDTNGNFTFGNNTNGQVTSGYMQTNGGIIWSSNSTTPPSGAQVVFDPTVNNTLQGGFGSMIVNQKLQIAAEQQIAAGIANLHFTNSGGGGSNFIAVTNINNNTVTVSNANFNFPTNLATENTLIGISNLLSGFGITNRGLSTNFAGAVSNLSSYMMGFIPATATNGSAATNAAVGAEGDYGVLSMLTLLNPVSNSDANGGGAPAIFTVNWWGQEINLDPVAMMPALQVVSYLGGKIVAELAFLYFLANLFWQTVRAKGSVAGGGVPDLEIMGGGEALTFGGFAGGNFVGVLIAILVPAAFIGLFTVVMFFFFSTAYVDVTEAMNLSAWEGNLGTAAFYLLTSYIPVQLIFTLAVTRLTLLFTLGHLYSIATNSARFLWTR